MLGGILIFLFLWGLIAIFERDRDDLDAFSIATAVIGPTVAVIVVRIASGLLGLGLWAGLLELLALVVVTFLVLTMHLEVKRGRAIGYTVAVVVFNFALGVGFILLTGAA